MITEEQINSYLTKGLRAYFSQLERGNKEEANLILGLTSMTADLLLDQAGIKNDYKKVTCGCGRQLTKGGEIEFYKQVGMCACCEHIERETI